MKRFKFLKEGKTYLLFIAIYGAKSLIIRGTYTLFEYDTSTDTCNVRECLALNSRSDTYEECTEYTPITSALGQQYVFNEDGDCMSESPCDVSELKWMSNVGNVNV
eukprot:538603_1